jgi:hypothetical protein
MDCIVHADQNEILLQSVACAHLTILPTVLLIPWSGGIFKKFILA